MVSDADEGSGGRGTVSIFDYVVGAVAAEMPMSYSDEALKAQAVAAQDKNSFTRASGVGPKLAARLVTELKDKIVTVPWEATSNGDLSQEGKMDEQKAAEITENYEDNLVAMTDDPSKMEDAISALVNLGYQRLEAYQAVNKASAANPEADVSGLIRLALKEFANKE